jgi:hypothetical protein
MSRALLIGLAALLVTVLIVRLFPLSGSRGRSGATESSAGAGAVAHVPVLQQIELREQSGDYSCDLGARVAKFVCLVRQAALGDAAAVGSGYRNAYQLFYAIEAMNIVQNLVSTSRYKYLHDKKGAGAPLADDAELCLDQGYGICGGHVATFLALMQEAGLPARSVGFYYKSSKAGRQSHVAAEVLVDNKWRYIDVTWGAFFLTDGSDPLSLASLDDILDHKTEKMVNNAAQPWFYVNQIFYEMYEYLSRNSDVVVGADSGTINPDVDAAPGGYRLNLSDVPAFVGDAEDDGPFEGVDYRLRNLSGAYKFDLDIAGVGGCESQRERLCVGSECISPKVGVNELRVSNPDRIYVQDNGGDHLCYYKFNDIRFEEIK